MKKVIVIFANSVKHGQHCVAGKCCSTKEWIRPVGDNTGLALTDIQAKYTNPYGEYLVKPLQKIVLDLSERAPLKHQPENWVIGTEKWVQNYNLKINEIETYLDFPTDLWGTGNKVHYFEFEQELVDHQSLYLIEVSDVQSQIASDGKRRLLFMYNGFPYNLPVTDPNFTKIHNGVMMHNNIVCISLGEKYNEFCYKIVACIL